MAGWFSIINGILSVMFEYFLKPEERKVLVARRKIVILKVRNMYVCGMSIYFFKGSSEIINGERNFRW